MMMLPESIGHVRNGRQNSLKHLSIAEGLNIFIEDKILRYVIIFSVSHAA
jgi:hypothetical protein